MIVNIGSIVIITVIMSASLIMIGIRIVNMIVIGIVSGIVSITVILSVTIICITSIVIVLLLLI